MQFSSPPSHFRASQLTEQRERRYPLLTFLDVTLSAALSTGVFALACLLLGIILAHNAPTISSHAWQIVARIVS